MGNNTPERADFVASNENAKSQTVGQFVRIARKARLDYADFLYVCQQARKKLGLKTPKKERKLPQLLSEAALQRFFRVIQDCGDVQHEIMLNCFSTRPSSSRDSPDAVAVCPDWRQ